MDDDTLSISISKVNVNDLLIATILLMISVPSMDALFHAKVVTAATTIKLIY